MAIENLLEKLKDNNRQTISKQTKEDLVKNISNLDNIKYMIIKNKNVKCNIGFIQDSNSIKNGIYTLPMKLSNGKVTDLNMYILNDNALNDKNLSLYLNFENMYNNSVQAYVKVSNQGTLADVVLKSNDNTKEYEKDILNILNKFDIYPDNITYSIDNKKDLHREEDIINIQEKFKDLENSFNEII